MNDSTLSFGKGEKKDSSCWRQQNKCLWFSFQLCFLFCVFATMKSRILVPWSEPDTLVQQPIFHNMFLETFYLCRGFMEQDSTNAKKNQKNLLFPVLFFFRKMIFFRGTNLRSWFSDWKSMTYSYLSLNLYDSFLRLILMPEESGFFLFFVFKDGTLC